MTHTLIQTVRSLAGSAMCADRIDALSELERIPATEMETPGPGVRRKLQRRKRILEASVRRRQHRRDGIPLPSMDPPLPIREKRETIVEAIRRHPVVVISGETGSGKTTQIPKYCLEAGCGAAGKVGCTQPRRIAATTVAQRIAEELGESIGQSVGYKIRFQNRTSKDAYIKVMTDGILLAEAQTDPYLGEYDCLIIDEAHERSLNIDFSLGLLLKLLEKRTDLRVVITSATIDTEKFSKAFGDAPIIEVSGRLYPVEVRYRPAGDESAGSEEIHYVEAAVAAVDRLRRRGGEGDILVFMPTEQDIRDTCTALSGKHYARTHILPLFARLPATEQSRVFSRAPGCKIVVATNVAETSITIPGIRYVVDTGLARISSYSPRSRTTSLPVMPISRSSADQRTGRCGRVREGICIRLYSEDDYLGRPLYTPPEILRTNLAEIILRMLALKLGDVTSFPFVDSPAHGSIRDGYRLLEELDAVRRTPGIEDAKKPSGRNAETFSLTSYGRKMARIPLDPRLSRMLLEATRLGCRRDVAILAAALSIRDPRERPADRTEEADRAHAIFADGDSDFLTLLAIWKAFRRERRKKTGGGIRRFCRSRFLSYNRMREWEDIHEQIGILLDELGESGPSTPAKAAGKGARYSPRYAALHKSILAGFLSNVAVRREGNLFRATKGREAMIFPGSALFDKAGAWIVCAEMVETSRLFARLAANIESAWIEEVGQSLCRTTYTNPRWDRQRGEVVADERVTLFGLVLVEGRKVPYGRIHPEEASLVFIRGALVDGDMERPFGFMEKNRKRMEAIRDMENRLRTRGLMVDRQGVERFYAKRLPGVVDIASMRRVIRKRGGQRFLHMQEEDLVLQQPETDALKGFPDKLRLGDELFALSYRFAPGDPADGATVRIPADQASTVAAESLDWPVPGLLREKIEALLKNLPKDLRKRLVPLSETVDTILSEMRTNEPSLLNTLARFLSERFGVEVPSAAWGEERLPDHLRTRIALVDPSGRELRAGRDRAILAGAATRQKRDDRWEAACLQWEMEDVQQWPLEEIPASIVVSGSGKGERLAYLALVADAQGQETVSLRLMTSREDAVVSHRRGVAALLEKALGREMKFLQKTLRLSADLRPAAKAFGGPASVQGQLLARIRTDLLERNIRTRKAFEEHAESVYHELLPLGRRLAESAANVLRAHAEWMEALQQLQRTHRANRSAQTLFAEMEKGIRRLVPDHFLQLYDSERLEDLVRYIAAARLRAERAPLDLEKDRRKSLPVRKFTEALQDLLAGISPTTTEEKRREVETFFWMIEEFKISIFAQELGTRMPVSEKRLENKLMEIRRMV